VVSLPVTEVYMGRDNKPDRPDPWAEENDNETPVRVLSREEAQALREAEPAVSPWRVVAAQAAVGLLVAGLAWLFTRQANVFWSALYGAVAVVLPSALMARGMTSRLTSLNPGVSAVSFMLWEMVKLGLTVVLLALAPKVVPGLSWPALLVALVIGVQMVWVALLWRGLRKNS
jgi:ATP synthase protein I